MVTSGKQLKDMAAQYNATILLEPFYQGFMACSKSKHVFLEEVDSARIRALLDTGYFY